MTTASTQQSVREIMSAPVLTTDLTDSLWDAWQLLSVSGLRHLVISGRNGECLGLLSDRQILAEVPATKEHLGALTVADLLNQASGVLITPDQTPRQAASLMSEHGIEAIPVCTHEGKILGIVTQTDLVNWIS